VSDPLPRAVRAALPLCKGEKQLFCPPCKGGRPRSGRGSLTHIVSLLLMLLVAPLVQAQVQPNLVINGVVQDQTGAAFFGAQVDLFKDGEQRSTTTTDASGSFLFERVQRGNYEVRVHQEGFKTETARVAVGPRSPARLRIVLSIETLNQQITVTGDEAEVSIDPSENRDVAAVNRQALDELPIFDEDVVATMSRFLDNSALGENGVMLIVDGVQGISALPPSAIQSVTINNNPYSAEYDRPGRSRIEITTKPGSPEYHGTINFLFRDARLNARDPFAIVRPQEQRRIFEGSLLGPIGDGKKTSFMFTGQHQEEDNQAIVFAIGPGGPIHENVAAPQRNTDFSFEVNRQHSDKTTYSIRFHYRNLKIRNQGVGGVTLPEAATDFHDREDQLFYTQKTAFSNTIVNQFRILVARQHTPTISVQSGPKIIVLDAFTGGGAQGDRLQTENHVILDDILSWIHGKHTFKSGFNIPDLSRRGLDDNTNSKGTFSFSSLQDYVDGRPFSFEQQRGNGRVIFWERLFGGFFQDEYQVRPNLQLTAGLRYDWQAYFHDTGRFGPRLSFAYAPRGSRKTVIRGGGGIFYDRTGPLPVFDLLRYDGQRLQRFLISNPAYPDPFANGAALTQPTSVVRLERHVQIPYTFQHGLSVEQQLYRGTTLTVSYFRTSGILFRSRDINAPLPPLYLARPNRSLNVLRQIETSARQVTDSLEFSFRGNVTRYFTGMAQYTLGSAYNNSSGIRSFPANNYDLSGEWSRADSDQRQRFNILGTMKAGRLFNVGVALQAESGRPYSMTTGRDDNHDGLALDRPAGVRRNSLEGPGYLGLDLRWSKDFLLDGSKKEKSPKLTAALDAFNVTNRVNYSGYIGNLSSPFFGRAIASRPARRLQLSMRFAF
jgi:Carboxypeptidase regulatory-like domain